MDDRNTIKNSVNILVTFCPLVDTLCEMYFSENVLVVQMQLIDNFFIQKVEHYFIQKQIFTFDANFFPI